MAIPIQAVVMLVQVMAGVLAMVGVLVMVMAGVVVQELQVWEKLLV